MKRKPEAVKLTDLQWAALGELSKKGSRAHYMPYMGRFNPNAYWFITSTMRHATKQIEGLLARGLLDRKVESPWGNKTSATINAAGRRLLRAAKGRKR